jgi:hypothetical protein
VFICVIDQAKYWIIIRYKCPDVVGHPSIGDARISNRSVLLSFVPLLIICISFRVLGEAMHGILGTLTLFTRTKLNWFGHD